MDFWKQQAGNSFPERDFSTTHSPDLALPLLTASEQERIEREWNATHAPYSKDHCFHHLFEAQVERTPEAIALTFENEQLTYEELNRRANQLACYLQTLGPLTQPDEQKIGPEVCVGLCIERSLIMVVALLGILKAGGAYVPLDPAYPSERLAFMLHNAHIPLLLTQQRLLNQLPEHEVRVVCLDAQWETIAQEPYSNPESVVTSGNLAYVIYTSGSTGRPKGTLVLHEGLCNLVEAQVRAFDVSHDSRVLQFASLSFDASISEIAMALQSGATLCLGTSASLLPGPNLIEFLQRQAITTVTLPPSVLAILPLVELPALQTLISAGEMCPIALAINWASKRRFFNAYGPTEATVCATLGEYTKGRQELPIGQPIANMQAYILDTALQPVPLGVSGELYLGGVGIARGYLQQPELTAERFLPHPWSDVPGARLYKTGDIARYLADDTIEYLGRLDQQVKVRGFRIELSEIESVLRQHPDVREVVVLLRADVPDEKYLVSYIIPKQGHFLTIRELRTFAKLKLPMHMLPSAFVMLEALPLTPNGKVDRRALPSPNWLRPTGIERFVAPRTPIEEELASIWADVLNMERIGVYDNFFELGGHSLLVTQVMSRVRDAFKVELPVQSFFATPTVADVAGIIEGSKREAQREHFTPIQAMPRTGELPLSFAQERVWFLLQLEPANMAYHAQATIQMQGKLNVAVLEQSLSEIIRRHEIFRTTFPAINGRPVQVIHDAFAVPLPMLDLQSLPEQVRAAITQQVIYAELRKPFDLTKLPLVRWILLRLDEQLHVLVHIEHHLVHDGWSFNVFLHELLELYHAFSVGKPSPLPALPIQFADFAQWQRQWLQGELAQRQLAYWKEKLTHSSPVLELPTDHVRPAVQRFCGAVSRVELPANLYTALIATARQEGVTLFMTMLAAFQTLLYRYTGQEDLCIGSGIANRRLRETEGLIGMIINTVVLRTDMSGNPTFRELLQRVRQVTLEAYAHQDLPFEKVVEALKPERTLSYNPLFQVAFAFHDSPLSTLEIPELTLHLQEGLNNGSAKFDLNIIVIPRSEQRVGWHSPGETEGMTLIWEYNTDLFDGGTIAHMIAHYQLLLEKVVTDREQYIEKIVFLRKDEQQQLLVEWNATGVDYQKYPCIQQLFEAQVRRTPENVAIAYGAKEDGQLSYRELNERANQLAYYLGELGVGPEVCVGLYMERGLEMVIGMLAILKAGGAFVPLDPAYPMERLAFILEDAQVLVLLTQERLKETFLAQSAKVVCLDSDWQATVREHRENPHCRVEGANLVYVIYTSGSTGKPKGVAVQHASLVNLACWHQAAFEVTATDRATQVAGQAFDASVWEVWPYLISGASVHIADDETRISPVKLKDWLTSQAITISFLPTVLADMLVAQDWPAEVALRTLLTGGDMLHSYPASSLPFRLVNNYGPTESTVVTTSGVVLPQQQEVAAPSIGRPIANTRIYVLDAHMQPVPIGVQGELYLGGSSLARGYLNRPELTAERFVPDPFSSTVEAADHSSLLSSSQRAGGRLYKTGDVVRYLPDGSLAFCGRNDDQVKLRGFRIELGEIEMALARHQAVLECRALACQDVQDEQQLVAYIVAHQGQNPTVAELRRSLVEQLPVYMIPSIFIMLEAIPLTPNGKVDRRALPVPEWDRFVTEEESPLPRTPTEEVIAHIWAEILRQKCIGVNDNFFTLGGHSLLATQVLHRVEDTFQVEIGLRRFFESPTVAGLAIAVVQGQAQQVNPDLLLHLLAQVQQAEVDPHVVFTSEEQEIWGKNFK